MPQSNEGILLIVGALFLLLGLLGGGFEISAIKIPPVGKFTQTFALVIGALVFGLGLMRLFLPTPPPGIVVLPTATAVALIPSAVPSPAPTATPNIPTPLPPTESVSTTALPVAAKIQDIWVDHNVTRFQRVGMLIHIKFNVSGMKDQEGRATAYFYQRDGGALQSADNTFNTSDGKVAAGESFTPGYDPAQYDDLQIFMPYDELELGAGKHELKFYIALWEKAHPENPSLAESPWIDFDFTK